jgi:RHS repeat-associated protein
MNNGSAFYYHYDPLGSIVNLTSATGATQWTDSYEPYGALHSETKNNTKAPANPVKFAGQYLDPTGLYHLAARQYDPSIGRFTSTDPKSTTTTQPYMSSYTYANDQPTVLTDPSGMGAIGNTCGSIWCFAQQDVAPYALGCLKGVVQQGAVAIATGGGSLGVGCAEGVGIEILKRHISEPAGQGADAVSVANTVREIVTAGGSEAPSSTVRVVIVVAG